MKRDINFLACSSCEGIKGKRKRNKASLRSKGKLYMFFLIDGKVAGEARFSILDISYNMSRHPQKRLEFSDTGAFTECNIGAKSKIY
ncbi:hypothetical protein HUJ05_004032 [Dendroctonus ponderosae]|nr:hypothetical protein HUJ05_004032 [Dendroctonus ponderosae]